MRIRSSFARVVLVITFVFALRSERPQAVDELSDLDRQLASTYCKGCVVLSLCRDAGQESSRAPGELGAELITATELIKGV